MKEVICIREKCRYNWKNHCMNKSPFINISNEGCDDFRQNESDKIKEVTSTQGFCGGNLKEKNKVKDAAIAKRKEDAIFIGGNLNIKGWGR